MYEVNISLTKERLVTLEIDKGDIIEDDILGPLIQLVLRPVGVHVRVGPQRPGPHSLSSSRGTPDYQSLRARSLKIKNKWNMSNWQTMSML